MRQVWVQREACVWHASLAADPSEYEPLLSPDEHARADSYGLPELRRRFIVRRGMLRRLLADRIGSAPEALMFCLGEFKKPTVVGCEFNVSSSGEEALFALAEKPVGVDIERIDPDFSFASVVADHFADREGSFTSPAAFFRAWCRKEAAAKALGFGLARQSPFLPEVGLHVLDIDVKSGFAAALALKA